MSYPVSLEVDYVEKRSRLTTFFRILLAIPLAIVGAVYAIGLYFALIIAWFALLFTARWPAGLHEFVAGVLRFSSRMTAYYLLLVDRYPPFGLAVDDGYPVRVRIAPPLEHYSRLKVFFRGLYAIPAGVIAYVLTIFLEILAFVSWLVIVIIGRQPAGLQNAMLFCLSYITRANALFYLLTETYPPFDA